MRISLIAFTAAGCELAAELCAALAADGCACNVCGPERFADEFGIAAYDSVGAWTKERFAASDALVFVSSTGIAVRAIAPYVRDKFKDPAVVSVDEAGRYVVSLLSGHVGGANDLARRVAQISGGVAVVSTATDVQGLFAVDEWARKMGLAICERVNAKRVSAALLEGQRVGFTSDFAWDGELPAGLVEGGEGECELGVCISLDDARSSCERTLHLVPQAVNLGIGCRRGTPAETIAARVDAVLAEHGISPRAICGVASIDVKADEEGLAQFAQDRGWPLSFFSAAELAAVQGEFTPSAFVAKTVGVDNVCERSAVALGGELIVGKASGDGVTVAASLVAPRLSFDVCAPSMSSRSER